MFYKGLIDTFVALKELKGHFQRILCILCKNFALWRCEFSSLISFICLLKRVHYRKIVTQLLTHTYSGLHLAYYSTLLLYSSSVSNRHFAFCFSYLCLLSSSSIVIVVVVIVVTLSRISVSTFVVLFTIVALTRIPVSSFVILFVIVVWTLISVFSFVVKFLLHCYCCCCCCCRLDSHICVFFFGLVCYYRFDLHLCVFLRRLVCSCDSKCLSSSLLG